MAIVMAIVLTEPSAVSSTGDGPRRPGIPPPQDNLARASEMAFEAVAAQLPAQLCWLGAERAGGAWRLPVFEDAFLVDLAGRRVSTSAGREPRPVWSILALHYLAVTGRPDRRPPEVTFADLSAARTYNPVYHGRVIARLCATAGRDGEVLRAAAAALGGRSVPGGDAAFDLQAFPRVCLRLIWHAADEEFPPTATLLLPSNIESYFCAEDIVVLSEGLVSRLGGRPF